MCSLLWLFLHEERAISLQNYIGPGLTPWICDLIIQYWGIMENSLLERRVNKDWN